MPNKSVTITRFAPSPNGWLHLGHAYSALWAARIATEAGEVGQFLLRIEDIDMGRARPHYIDAITQDLAWLGLRWRTPVLKQSERFDCYQAALKTLRDAGLVYPCWATRSEIAQAIAHKTAHSRDWQHDPDGAPLYPGIYRDISEAQRQQLMWEGKTYAWRLDMRRALNTLDHKLHYYELDVATGKCARLPLDPRIYGDVVLARKDMPTSYHLSVVIDDAAQNITHVTRGTDLQPATAIHRLLQDLLGLPEPIYFHHPLIRDTSGRKLSKQAGDEGFRRLRQQGWRADEVIALLPPPFGATRP